ncbi:MAG: hypothetical protein U0R52_11115 [Solirubrobacterales bacterium]
MARVPSGSSPSLDILPAGADAPALRCPSNRGNSSPLAIARYGQNGDLDSKFGSGGLAEGYPLAGIGISIAVQPDGRILATGVAVLNPSSARGTCIVLIRRNPSGVPDSRFGRGPPGRVHTCMWVHQTLRAGLEGQSVLVGGDRKIIVGGVARYGNSRSTGIVVRYKPDGRNDPSFSGDRRTRSWRKGAIEIGAPGQRESSISEVKLAGRGKILVSGQYGGRFLLARLNRNGSLDRSFGRKGITTTDVDGAKKCACSFGRGMAIDRHRRILAVGYYPNHIALVRYHRDGRLDRSFGRKGIVRTKLGQRARAFRVAVQHDGRIVVAAESDGRFTVVRYRAGGHLDQSFFGDGVYATKFFGGQDSVAYDLLIDGKGRIVASGGGPNLGQFVLLRFLQGPAPRVGQEPTHTGVPRAGFINLAKFVTEIFSIGLAITEIPGKIVDAVR